MQEVRLFLCHACGVLQFDAIPDFVFKLQVALNLLV